MFRGITGRIEEARGRPHCFLTGGLAGALLSLFAGFCSGAEPAAPQGFHGFGADQTIVDVGKVEWQPLKAEGLPAGIEIAALRGDLAKGGGEVLLRLPANYTVPNHSHTSDELYVWLKGAFAYVAADGEAVEIAGPAYISLPGNTPHALKCHNEPCVFYVRYGRPFDLHLHAMPK
jgi:quercetin dioxygenase-like cupin family protein